MALAAGNGQRPERGNASTSEGSSGEQQAVDRVQTLLEGFSLTTLEALTLTAMMRLGSATPNQLAPITGVGRTNLYRLLESLQQRQLVRKSTQGRNAVWVAADRKEIIWRLRQREQERFEAAEEALEDLETTLATVPTAGERAASVVEVTDEVTNGFRYEQAVSAVKTELLVLNRGPYAGEIAMSDAVLGALERGVKARAIWQRHELYGPEAEEQMVVARGYAEAGVETRVADELPACLAVMDRSVTLLSLPGQKQGDTPYVANAFIDNRAMAELMVQAFDHLWIQAEPLGEQRPAVRAQSKPRRRKTKGT